MFLCYHLVLLLLHFLSLYLLSWSFLNLCILWFFSLGTWCSILTFITSLIVCRRPRMLCAQPSRWHYGLGEDREQDSSPRWWSWTSNKSHLLREHTQQVRGESLVCGLHEEGLNCFIILVKSRGCCCLSLSVFLSSPLLWCMLYELSCFMVNLIVCYS